MTIMRVHVSGLDKFLRDYDRKNSDIENALHDGVEEATEYLRESMENKFGSYQSSGGTRGGPWDKLKYETIVRKRKKGNGGNANKPLVDYGDMMFSLDMQTSNRTRKHTMTITSDDEKILFHVFGVPRRGVPKRDPIRPTIDEEREMCFKIVADAVRKVLKK